MLQCQGCHIWQHKACVLPSEQPQQPRPREFYCERCRLARADPFWETLDTPVCADMLLRPTGVTARNPEGKPVQVQQCERSFQLSTLQLGQLPSNGGNLRLQVRLVREPWGGGGGGR